MASWTVALKTTSGATLRSKVIDETDLIPTLRAEGIIGRELPSASKLRDGKGAAVGGQYVAWTRVEQVTARQAVPGTTVYVTSVQGVATGMDPLAVRERQVVVGQWLPSISLGLGYADLIDETGVFRGAYGPDDLLHVVPAYGRRPVPSYLM